MRRFEPILDAEGNVAEWKKKGMYFYIHDEELRSSYDTFKVIERLNKVGFKEQPTSIESVTKNYIVTAK